MPETAAERVICRTCNYVVRRMESSIASCHDLAFLVPQHPHVTDEQMNTPFLVYCNSRQDTVRIGNYLRARLPLDRRDSIRWVHAGMSDNHRKVSVHMLEEGKLLVLMYTDALGMYMYVGASIGFSNF